MELAASGGSAADERTSLLALETEANTIDREAICNQTETWLIIVGSASFAFSILELTFSFKCNSLAMAAETIRSLSDVGAMYVAFKASRLQLEPKTAEFPFGYSRSQVLGGLLVATCFVSLLGYLLLCAVANLLQDKSNFNPNWGFVLVAAMSAFLNLSVAAILHNAKHSETDRYPSWITALSCHCNNSKFSQLTSAFIGPSYSRSQRKKSDAAIREVRRVALNIALSALYSVFIFALGLVVLLMGDSFAWVDYLDPSFTLVFCAIMSWPMQDIIEHAVHQLLEGSVPLDQIRVMSEAVDQSIRSAGYKVSQLICTPLDLDGTSRASIALVPFLIGSQPHSVAGMRRQVKSILAAHGAKWASVEFEEGDDDTN
jgi:cation diffusion facilitator family transporter